MNIPVQNSKVYCILHVNTSSAVIFQEAKQLAEDRFNEIKKLNTQNMTVLKSNNEKLIWALVNDLCGEYHSNSSQKWQLFQKYLKVQIPSYYFFNSLLQFNESRASSKFSTFRLISNALPPLRLQLRLIWLAYQAI